MEPFSKEEIDIRIGMTDDSQIAELQSPSVEEPYPTGLRLLSILVPLGICTFLIALVRSRYMSK
jgi:hypothetical protein